MTPHHCERLHPGQGWSRIVPRHHVLRLTLPVELSSTPNQPCVAVLLFNARQPIERYNMPDTLKAQYTAFVTAGRVLLSDMGHVLASVVRDDTGWIDTLGGINDEVASRVKYGPGTYQDRRNDRHRNSRDNLLVELGKWELGERDLHANLNVFAKVVSDADGGISLVPGHVGPGATVELRMEMDVLVVLSNTPHPLDPATSYGPPPVDLAIGQVSPPAWNDPCRLSRQETRRAFTRTEALFPSLHVSGAFRPRTPDSGPQTGAMIGVAS